MSSISDNNKYPNFCKQAANDILTFSSFKQNTFYNEILEHVTYEEGIAYINQFKNNKSIFDNISKFKINDTLGSPRTYSFADIGEYSPTTLRYIKILNDLSQIDLNDKTIIEIGAGYGGQYTVLRQLFKPKKYIFIDLPSVLDLIKKYITTLKLDDIEIEYIDGSLLSNNISADMVISNYAFSECDKTIQDVYIKHILQHTKHCYMIYNNMHGYNHHEFIEKTRPGKVKISEEVPQTHPKNVVLTW